MREESLVATIAMLRLVEDCLPWAVMMPTRLVKPVDESAMGPETQ